MSIQLYPKQDSSYPSVTSLSPSSRPSALPHPQLCLPPPAPVSPSSHGLLSNLPPVFSYYPSLSHSSQPWCCSRNVKSPWLQDFSGSQAPIRSLCPAACPQHCPFSILLVFPVLHRARSQSPPSPAPCHKLPPTLLPPGTTALHCWEPSPVDSISL